MIHNTCLQVPLSLGVSWYIRRSQCDCIIKYNFFYYNYIILPLQYHSIHVNTHLSVWLPVATVVNVELPSFSF